MNRVAIYDTGVAYVVETSKGYFRFYNKNTLKPISTEMPLGSFYAHANGYLNPVRIEFDDEK